MQLKPLLAGALVVALSTPAAGRPPAESASAGLGGWSRDSRTYTRSCSDSVNGDVGEKWRENSIVVGRLAFIGARDYRNAPRRWFQMRDDGTYRIQKIMIQVENGDDMIMRIPRRHRAKAALVYDPSLFGRRLRVSEADYQVRLDVCANVLENPFRADVTQYNGGFIVTGARCVPVVVLTGEGKRIKRVRISFGAGHCHR